MQVFVTGANGFIGGAVAAALIAAGHKVRGMVRNNAKASAVAAHDVQAVVGPLDDAALLQGEAHAATAAHASGCQPLLASCHLDANRDGCAGDDHGIFVLRVVNIETALNGLHGDIADGQEVLDLLEIHLLWPLDTDCDLHIELGLVDPQ
jgi:nucleoside-diphosphate-sugar epimerase